MSSPGNFGRGEPELDLFFGRLDAVAAVNDVATHVDTKVAAYGARRRVLRPEANCMLLNAYITSDA